LAEIADRVPAALLAIDMHVDGKRSVKPNTTPPPKLLIYRFGRGARTQLRVAHRIYAANDIL
jgi:hypothetical protein